MHAKRPGKFREDSKVGVSHETVGGALTQPERRARLERIPQVGLLITHDSLPPSACKTSYIKARKKVSLLAE